jgi:hypothetical protein
MRAGMARIPKDDLPDDEREIFLSGGLDRKRIEARNAQVICPSSRFQAPLVGPCPRNVVYVNGSFAAKPALTKRNSRARDE